MKTLTKIDFCCLSWIADDYENIQHIKDVIKIHDSLNVSEEDIFTSLRKLIGEKFAQAYEYDSTKQEFIEVEFPENISSNYWFYITRAGVGCLCENQKVHPEQ
jgi:hypothetical protein